MVHHSPVEVAKTVLEVADLAWTAVECCHHHHHQGTTPQETAPSSPNEEEEKRDLQKLEALRLENQRLRTLLEQNLQLLGNISQSPSFYKNCPRDLHVRLLSAVSSEMFLKKLESKFTDDCSFPFKEPTCADMEVLEIPIEVGHKESSWWVWVSDEMVPSNVEEMSGLDHENYVIVSEDVFVESVADFIAKCIASDTRAKGLSPKELQKAVTKALGGSSKVGRIVQIWQAGQVFLSIASWGVALAGLYRSRAILRHAAIGVHTVSKVVMKAI